MPIATKSGSSSWKRCPVCGLLKRLEEFPPRRDRKSGPRVMSRCHECDAAKQRRSYWFGGGRERKAAYDRARAEGRKAGRDAS